jgi:RHS repeat-associated protein
LQIYATCPSQAACPNQPSAYIINLSFNFNLGNGTTGSDNGNVIGITNNRVGARSENFAYDSLNRITAGYSTGTNWGESYTIDAWGNLTNIGTYTGKNPLGNLACAGGNTKNQLNTCFGYDAAGNMTSNGSTVYTYDAENRLTATGGMLYIYDGDGQRVAKCAVSNCAVGTSGTFYWRSVAGETLVESDVAGSFQNEYVFFNGQRIARRSLTGTEPVYYYFSDHLGSHSIVTDTNGVIQDESDFSPYGEEMVVSESIAQNYKFTGKERDSESGLDMFGARYYGSSLGRFMTPDWAAGPNPVPYASFSDPQTLNLYGYVRNNPLSRADIDGHHWWNKLGNLFTDAGCWCEGEKAKAAATAWRKKVAAERAGTSPELRAQFSFQVTVIVTVMTLGTNGGHGGEIIDGFEATEGGVLDDANYAQTTFSQTFSDGGAFAGKTVDEVAAALRSGDLKPADVPIQYVVKDGNTLILNTPSAQALEQAGIPRSQWNSVNVTGDAAAEARLSGQLQRNNLTSAGTPTVAPEK